MRKSLKIIIGLVLVLAISILLNNNAKTYSDDEVLKEELFTSIRYAGSYDTFSDNSESLYDVYMIPVTGNINVSQKEITDSTDTHSIEQGLFSSMRCVSSYTVYSDSQDINDEYILIP